MQRQTLRLTTAMALLFGAAAPGLCALASHLQLVCIPVSRAACEQAIKLGCVPLPCDETKCKHQAEACSRFDEPRKSPAAFHGIPFGPAEELLQQPGLQCLETASNGFQPPQRWQRDVLCAAHAPRGPPG